jgi:predicted small lipoprotein YifL
MCARRSRPFVVAALLVAVLALAACSRKGPLGDDNEAVGTSTEPMQTSTSTTTVATDSSVPAEDPGASTSTTSPEEEPGAFGHTDAELASFRAAYSAAFEGECHRIWSSYAGADGLMADPDFAEDTYAVDDCLIELDADYGELADSVEEAQTTGVDDAQIAASDLADPLCATGGAPCWSYGDS